MSTDVLTPLIQNNVGKTFFIFIAVNITGGQVIDFYVQK